MTKQEILDEFNDIDYVYNNSSKHETLSQMLDELLNEQEAVVPQKHYNKKADLLYACGKCNNDLKPNNRNAKFCWFCGQKVKWK